MTDSRNLIVKLRQQWISCKFKSSLPGIYPVNVQDAMVKSNISMESLSSVLTFLVTANVTEDEAGTSTSSDVDEGECDYTPLNLLDFKLVVVGVLGASVAVISLVFNVMLLYTFIASSMLRKRNLTYLTWLCIFDIITTVMYFAIMCVQVYAEYFQCLPLYILWHKYLKIAFSLSHVFYSTIAFLLVAATIDRCFQIKGSTTKFATFIFRHRLGGVIFSFILSLIFRGGYFLEIDIIYLDGCEGFASYSVAQTELAQDPIYHVYKFWVRKGMTTVMPFLVLLVCNLVIVCSLQSNTKNKMVKTLILHMMKGHGRDVNNLKSRVRAATQTLFIVVACYLISNAFEVVVSFFEHFSPETLAEHDSFYTVATDVSSLLAVMSSAIRLPIYMVNDPLLSYEVKRKVRKLYYIFRCSPQQYKKQKVFGSEKRRLIYEQVERPTSTPPVSCGNRANSKMSIDSSKIKPGIGSLIVARASVVSAMQDSHGINYERCAALHEQALARQCARLSSTSSIEDSVIHVCDNPEGPYGYPRYGFVPSRRISASDRLAAHQLRKKISAPPKLTPNLAVIEAAYSDIIPSLKERSASTASEKQPRGKKSFITMV